MSKLMDAVRHGEEGHTPPLAGVAIGAAGAILLGIGAANDTGWLAVVGGIVLAVGLVATLLISHMAIEYDIYARLDKLESK